MKLAVRIEIGMGSVAVMIDCRHTGYVEKVGEVPKEKEEQITRKGGIRMAPLVAWVSRGY